MVMVPMPFLLALPTHNMPILLRRNGSWILVVHITWLRMLLYFLI
jgi:hypothetical protein